MFTFSRNDVPERGVEDNRPNGDPHAAVAPVDVKARFSVALQDVHDKLGWLMARVGKGEERKVKAQ